MPTRAVIVTGVRDIDRKLKSLLPRLERKVIRQGMRAGLKLMAAEVKAQSPVETGATRRNVKVRSLRRRRNTISMEVRIKAVDELKRTSAKTGKTVFYPAIVEYKRRHFMRRSFDAKKEAARKLTITTIRAGVEREIKASGP
jgi:Bacteriophage HK97-gp10, putative tail-component